MSQILKTSLLIVGGGPGGYVAAIRAGQLGIPTVLVEGAALGGTCLNVGCIPSKALIHAAEEYLKARHYAGRSALGIQVQAPSIDIARTVEWKDAIVDRLTSGVAALLKKHGVDVVQGWARILDGKSVAVELAGGGSQRIECEHLLLAAGSQSVELPILPLGGKVISSTEALAPGSLPKRLVVVGGGYIGLELGTAYRKLGVEVGVVEAQPRILPGYDEELTKPVAQALRKLGVELYLGHSLLGPSENGVRVRDGAGEPMLAHRAMAQGEMVAELIAGKRRQFAPVAIPAVCFTDPEVVVAGLSPEQAKDAGLDCLVASFPFAANGRAMTLEANEGFVRVVARRDNHLVVGWQAVGKAVSELSTAFAQSLEMGARLEDIAGTIHAHPTLGEAVQEAALRALGHALHI
ncbi:FAD-dependent oxidoreductase [Pseudomonas aeruginosa]|uniref:FAD-dependent oxidoreductase n=1 Tax=Pseudomonas aeruginosa TaxID=287 RepID=UPI00287C7548|nr:FAD-dependent oxidoreductase [Pseudomonas aeruginosa]MDS9435081.1 FAD-dependent oxidoreductase [Pseudomonas aeruginosa]MDT8500134.1 FAD-dependent oxidoreductase [Pseudomonas aeruginosa]